MTLRALLDDTCGLPLDRPFTTSAARAAGVSGNHLGRLVAGGLLRRVLRGVYVATQVRDTLDLRADALALVVPPEGVVTDRTAGWLLGANMILAPGDHLAVPPVSVFLTSEGRRLRNEVCASGERRLGPHDVTIVRGIRTTTPLRTACDLGRLLHRDQAFAAMDSLMALGFSAAELVAETSRFRGYRGVVQLRALAPHVDWRAQSPGESITRLRWIDLGLPKPEPQLEVPGPHGPYFLDLGLEELRFAVEYDGAEFHSDDEREHDEGRRAWIAREHDFTIRVLRAVNLFGARRDAADVILDGFLDARRALGLRSRWMTDLT